ncbi:hypothetical protein RFI_30612, partial [Reticulomyxa filosa]
MQKRKSTSMTRHEQEKEGGDGRQGGKERKRTQSKIRNTKQREKKKHHINTNDETAKDADKEWARVISQLVMDYPLQKHMKIRHIKTEEAIEELKKMATEMKPLVDLVGSHESSRSKELQRITVLLLNHVSVVFGRNIVEILLNLVESTEEEIQYWSDLCVNESKGISNWFHWKRSMNKDGYVTTQKKEEEEEEEESEVEDEAHTKSSFATSSKDVLAKRLKEFRRLRRELLEQIGHIQTWCWRLYQLHGYSVNGNDDNHLDARAHETYDKQHFLRLTDVPVNASANVNVSTNPFEYAYTHTYTYAHGNNADTYSNNVNNNINNINN